MRSRNCTIDCLKFLFSWVVVFLHFYQATHKHFIGGYITVEYFLLTASVFVYEKHSKMVNTVNGGVNNYIISRFKRLFPWTFSALIFTEILWRGFMDHITAPGKILDNSVYAFTEALLLKMNGIATNSATLRNPPSWTISSMLIVEFIIWYCLKNHEELFKQFIAPMSIIFGLGIWMRLPDNQIRTWVGVTTLGTFRTWIVYCEGYYCWCLIKKLNNISLNKDGKFVVTGIEFIIYAFSIWVMMNRSSIYYQWFVTFLFVIAIAISLSDHSLLNQLLNKNNIIRKICGFLGAFSLSVYLLHSPILNLFSKKFPEPEMRYSYKFYMIGIVIICSLAQWYIVPKCVKLIQKLWIKIKNKLTMTDVSDDVS